MMICVNYEIIPFLQFVIHVMSILPTIAQVFSRLLPRVDRREMGDEGIEPPDFLPTV